MFEQKKTKQDEQKNVYSLIELPEVTGEHTSQVRPGISLSIPCSAFEGGIRQ